MAIKKAFRLNKFSKVLTDVAGCNKIFDFRIRALYITVAKDGISSIDRIMSSCTSIFAGSASQISIIATVNLVHNDDYLEAIVNSATICRVVHFVC